MGMFDVKEFFKTLTGLKIELPYSNKVSGLEAQLIWQFLRFNKEYQHQYEKLKLSGDDTGELAMFFAQSWCLSTVVDYTLENLPIDYDDDGTDLTPFFDYKPIRKLPKWKHIKEWAEVIYPEDKQLLIVNPYAHPRQVAEYLQNGEPEIDISMRDLRIPQLVEYIVCHHYQNVLGMGPKEFSPIYHEIFHPLRTDTIQSSSLQKKLDGFQKVVETAPWCFFTPTYH